MDRYEAAPPHPPLLGYHRRPQDRERFVRDLFNQTAASYDRINRAFALGTGGWYRRRALLRAGLQPGARVLDIAIGTGLVAREAIRITGRRDSVLGLDLSEGMLAEAKRRIGLPLVQARAEALPFGDASMDFVTMGYALRHLADLPGSFREYRRVLRPGGRLLVLEIARPEGRSAQAALRFYLGRLTPLVSRWLGGGRGGTLMQYYWDTIEHCVAPAAIQDAMRQAGFAAVRSESELGIFRAYLAQR